MLDIPQHIAIIMDGNGRWAQSRGLPRTAGHMKGAMAVKSILRTAKKIGVKYITLFAFSSENFSRPKKEVDFLMKLFEKVITRHSGNVIKNKIKFRVIGDTIMLPESLKYAISHLVDKTVMFRDFNLTVAINYGARNEVLRAVNMLPKNSAQQVSKNIEWDDFKNFLYTSDIPDPDMIIRTSGEQRLSNFLLLQAAYSELYFTKKFWPDFGENDLMLAIDDYRKRDRRLGNVNEG